MPFDRIRHVLRLSLHSLMVHRLRSILTILGIVLGVASVIIMLAVGEAARYEAIQQLQGLGATNIIVRSVKPIEDSKKDTTEDILTYGVTLEDMERIHETIPSVQSVTPMREFRKDADYLDHTLEARVVSVMPNYFPANGLKLVKGRLIDRMDNERFENVAVLGAETAEKLFPIDDPIGRTVRLDGSQYYSVIGVTARRASSAGIGSSLSAQDYNRDVYIPFETDRVRFGSVLAHFSAGNFKMERLELSQMTLAVDSMEHVKQTAEIIQSTLEQFHPKKDFEITVPLDLLERAEKTQRIFTLVLGAIASISLIVGGIGIMNIMLATVTERTKEIGIRRALGAKRRDIAWQFLAETMTLSSLGGFLGVGLGVSLSYAVTHFFQFPTILRAWSTILAFGVSVLVGLIFGTYPAQRAARMDPIEALRHE
ncbi:MAG TPA: ABC transporter permease [Gemmataceae bacterium]|nr:ABC transporter permease [Gemmataceae bacterium]